LRVQEFNATIILMRKRKVLQNYINMTKLANLAADSSFIFEPGVEVSGQN